MASKIILFTFLITAVIIIPFSASEHAYAQTSTPHSFLLNTSNTDPRGIAFADGKFWVVDHGTDRVYSYGSDGTHDPDSGFALNSANTDSRGITFADGKFWILDFIEDRVFAYNPDGTFDADSGFALNPTNAHPGAIAFADGKFWVSDFIEDSIFAYGPDGTYEPDFGFALDASNPTPFGLASTDSKLWVADFAVGKIYAYGLNGSLDLGSSFALDAGNVHPDGMTFADGKLWVADSFDKRVYSYDTTSSHYSIVEFSLDHGNGSSTGITFANDRFWVTDFNEDRIYAYKLDGTHDPFSEFTVQHDHRPSGITFADGKFWMTDVSKGIFVYNSDGTFAPDSGFDLTDGHRSPDGITFADGKFWVVDRNNKLIRAYDPDGTYEPDSSFEVGNTSTPSDITFADDKFWVTDLTQNMVHAYNADGTYDPGSKFALEATNNASTGITFVDGKFWVVDVRVPRIHAYGPDGTYDPSSGFGLDAGNTNPTGIAFADGKLWSVDFNDPRVYAYAPDGTHDPFSEFLLDTENAFPNGITAGNGKLWVVDNETDRVHVYDPDGTYDPSSGFTLHPDNASAIGIAFDSEAFYVVDSVADRVFEYSPDGEHVPNSGFELIAMNVDPTGITFVDNRFWVTDEGDNHVFGYDSDGNYDPASKILLDVSSHDATGITFAEGKFWVIDSNDTIYAYVPTTSVRGTVFSDANGNGVQDTGELGIEGHRMLAIDYSTLDIVEAYTAPDGSYSFDIAPSPATTLVQTNLYPQGHTLSSDDWYAYLTPQEGSTSRLDVGFYPVPENERVTLEITVYGDENLNGIMDSGESPISDVRGLYAYTYTIGQVASPVPDSGGRATVDDLVPADFALFVLADQLAGDHGYVWVTTTYTRSDDIAGKQYDPAVPAAVGPEPGSTHTMAVGLSKDTGAAGMSIVEIGGLVPISRADGAGVHRQIATEIAVSDFNQYLEGNGAQWRMASDIRDVTELGYDGPIRSFDEKGIQFVTGPSASSGVREIKDYVDANDMLLVSCCSTAPSLAIEGDNIFRLAADDSLHGPVIADLMLNDGKEVLIPVWRDDAFGDGLHDSTVERFMERGGIVDDIGSYSLCEEDGCYDSAFDTIMHQLEDKVQSYVDSHGSDKVAVLYIGVGESESFFAKAADYPVLRTVQWIGSDANVLNHNLITNAKVFEFLKDANFRSCIFDADSTGQTYQSLETRLASDPRIIGTPNVYTYASYDAVWILGLAIEAAGDAGFDEVKRQVPLVASDYQGALGDIELNAAGDAAEATYAVWGIESEGWVRIGTYVHGVGLVPSQ